MVVGVDVVVVTKEGIGERESFYTSCGQRRIKFKKVSFSWL